MRIKHLLAGAAALITAGTLASTPASARTLDPDVPEDAVEISKRFQCGPVDNETVVYYWAGKIYSRVQGEPDRHLFDGKGFNIRRCVKVEDETRGTGYKLITREAMFYLDTETGEVVDEWVNPWTDETVPVMQIHNDPVNSRPTFPYGADGSPLKLSTLRIEGPYVFMPFEVPLFYHNVLAGDYQDYVGNKYHAMEIFDFAAMKDELLDSEAATAYPMISWVRISDWMPWMKMRGRQGQIVFNAMGRKLRGGFEELPDVVKNEVRENYPIYEDAPPATDTRKNETTWTKFKLLEDRRREAAGEKPAAGGH